MKTTHYYFFFFFLSWIEELFGMFYGEALSCIKAVKFVDFHVL